MVNGGFSPPRSAAFPASLSRPLYAPGIISEVIGYLDGCVKANNLLGCYLIRCGKIKLKLLTMSLF